MHSAGLYKKAKLSIDSAGLYAKSNLIYATENWSIFLVKQERSFHYVIESKNLFMVDFKDTDLSIVYQKLIDFEEKTKQSHLWGIYKTDHGYHASLLSEAILAGDTRVEEWTNLLKGDPIYPHIILKKVSHSQRFTQKFYTKHAEHHISDPPIFYGFFGNINSMPLTGEKSNINYECFEVFAVHKYLCETLGREKNIRKELVDDKLKDFSPFYANLKDKVNIKSYIKIATLLFSIVMILLRVINVTEGSTKQFIYFSSVISALYVAWIIFYPTLAKTYTTYYIAPKFLKLLDNSYETHWKCRGTCHNKYFENKPSQKSMDMLNKRELMRDNLKRKKLKLDPVGFARPMQRIEGFSRYNNETKSTNKKEHFTLKLDDQIPFSRGGGESFLKPRTNRDRGDNNSFVRTGVHESTGFWPHETDSGMVLHNMIQQFPKQNSAPLDVRATTPIVQKNCEIKCSTPTLNDMAKIINIYDITVMNPVILYPLDAINHIYWKTRRNIGKIHAEEVYTKMLNKIICNGVLN